MSKEKLAALTRREREIMNAVFALDNRATAEAIRLRLVNPPSDSSVRVMLARLERKQLLKHEQDGARFRYSAAVSPALAKRTALRQVAQTFFAGSRGKMITALLADSPWNESELDALQEEIERARREGGVRS